MTTMHQRVQYPESIEPLVQFIEETPRAEILDKTLAKLREGVDIEQLLTASALAVTRSSDLPPGHHGGPLHPVAGLYPIWQLVKRLEGEDKFLPVMQHVALANKHVHDPVTSPFSLLEFDAIDADGSAQTKAEFLAGDGQGTMAKGTGIEGAKEAFMKAVGRGETNKADHLFLWIWDNMSPNEAFDLLMSVAIPKNGLDDHYFMYPATCWRALETFVDKQYLKVLMRPVVRYVTRFPTTRSYPEIDRLIEEHGLLGRILRQRTGDDESAAVGGLGEAIRDCDDFNEIPKMIAKALVDGLSMEGAGESLSIGAAGLFMRSLTGNPMDVHLHTSAQHSALAAEARRPQHEQQAVHPADLAHGPGNQVDAVPDGARRRATRHGCRGEAAEPLAGRPSGSDQAEHLHPAGDRLVAGLQPGPHARGAGGQGHDQSVNAIHEAWL